MATEQLTGQATKATWSLDDEQALIQAFQANKLVTLGSKFTLGETSKIIEQHAYALVDYNPQTQLFTLYNPWGLDNYGSSQDDNPDDGKVELSWAEIQIYFDEWDALQ